MQPSPSSLSGFLQAEFIPSFLHVSFSLYFITPISLTRPPVPCKVVHEVHEGRARFVCSLVPTPGPETEKSSVLFRGWVISTESKVAVQFEAEIKTQGAKSIPSYVKSKESH